MAWVAALPAGAQAPIPDGAQFEVNSYTTDEQRRSSVAVTAAGDFVAVWDSEGSFGSDTSNRSILGQRHASDGSALGAEFQINSYTTSGQANPSVAVASGGEFVVVWESTGSVGPDLSFTSIQGQRYASGGSALGAQFQVNTYTSLSQSEPSIAVAGDGDFVVVWAGPSGGGTHIDILGQRYASDGSTQGGEFLVNTYMTGSQFSPTVAAGSDGDFVVVWESNGASGTDTSYWSVQGQRYASDGSTQGAQFQVNSYTTSAQRVPSVSVAPGGDFVVVWGSAGSFGSDSDSSSIQGQRYASDGSPQGAEFQINTYTNSHQALPSVAKEPDGDFVVAWESYGSAGTDSEYQSIQGQRYASDGSPQGAEFQVNSHTTGIQQNPAIAARDGSFVVVWTSNASGGADSFYSIQGQRYLAPDPPAPVPALSTATALALCAALVLAAGYALRRRA
jgi:hypothetical protein